MIEMDLAAMADLRAEDVEYLVFHTLGPVQNGVPYDIDQSAEEINRYHRGLGWSGIGYHWLIRKDGQIEIGRPMSKQGAHCLGLNARSIGVAFSGNGDIAPLTPAQMAAAVDLGARIARNYDIPVERIIGHREVNRLVESGVLPSKYLTSKSCPGVRVSPAKIRLAIAERLFPAPEPIDIEVPEIPVRLREDPIQPVRPHLEPPRPYRPKE